jgi:hypothetical protein
MSVLPPPVPPLPPQQSVTGPTTGSGEGTLPDLPVERDTGGGRHALSVPWRWILAIGWSVVMGALGAIAQSAFLADSGPFWLAVKPLPFFLPVLALLALVGNWRHTLQVSAVAAVATSAIAAGDLVAGYGLVAATELVCGVSALVLTLAGALSRPPRTDAPAT